MEKYYAQETSYTCGPASMKMVLENFKIKKSEEQLAKLMKTNRVRGTWRKHFQDVARKYKLKLITKSHSSIKELKYLIKNNYKIIVCYYYPKEKFDHYSVVKNILKNEICFLDPWFGPNHKYHLNYFNKIWKMNPRFSKDRKWFFAVKK